MGKYVLLGLLLAVSTAGWRGEDGAQHGAIEGRVVSSNLDLPIEGIAVEIADLGITRVTGRDGRFRFVSVPAGSHQVVVHAAGYWTATRAVELPAGAVVQLDIVLRPVIDYAIRLASRSFVPEPGVEFAADITLRPTIRRGSPVHAIVQLYEIPRRGEREALRVQGVELLEALGGNAWLAAISDSVPFDALAGRLAATDPSLALLRWIGNFRPEDRVDPRLLSEGPSAAATEADGRAHLSVAFFDDVPARDAERFLADHRAEIRWRSGNFVAFHVLARPSIVADLMYEDGVRLINEVAVFYGVSDGTGGVPNPNTRARLNTDKVHALGVLGAGVVVAVWDDPYVWTLHPDLSNPTDKVRIHPPGSSGISSHATRVAGIVAGTGDNGSEGKGHAPGALIVSIDYHDKFQSVDAAMEDYDAVVGNNSWNRNVGWERCRYFHPWTTLCGDENECEGETVDKVLSNGNVCFDQEEWTFLDSQDHSIFGSYNDVTPEPDADAAVDGFIALISAGNDRNDPPRDPRELTGGEDLEPPDWAYTGYQGFFTIAPHASAKNVITVGGLNARRVHFPRFPCGDVENAQFAGWGPVDDGRIRPDVVAPAVRIVSTAYDPNDLYTEQDGTSFSTPAVTGIAALLVEEFRAQYSVDPRPATIKAVLVHSARDRCSAGPDYRSGWGEVDALAAYNLVHNTLLLEGQIAEQSEIQTFRMDVASPPETLRFTLAWDDPADTEPELNNDLDLHVQGPDGTLYYPWKTFPSDPDQPARPKLRRPQSIHLPDFPDESQVHEYVDDKNNVEKIEVSEPLAGSWLVRVAGSGLADGAPQPYSIVADFPLERAYVNIAQVIDRSASMGFSTHGKVAYMDVALDRAREFIGHIQVTNETRPRPTADNIALVTFNAQPCITATEKAQVILPLQAVSQAAQNAIDASITTGGCTSIGAGIREGLHELDKAPVGNPRAMVVLTDGYENTPPYALDELPDVDENIEIYTITLGNFADEQLMQEIASSTGGVFLSAPGAGNDLLEVYLQIQADVLGSDLVVMHSDKTPVPMPPEDTGATEELAVSSARFGVAEANARDTPVAVQNAVRTWQIPIESGVAEVVFAVAWVDTSTDFTLEVRDPDNAEVVVGETVQQRHDAAYRIVRVADPAVGGWSVTLRRHDDREVTTEYTFAAFVSGDISFWAWAPDRMLVNECLPATVEVRDGRMQRPLTGLAAHGLVRSPTRSRLRRYFDMTGPTHGAGAVAQPPQDSVPRWVSTLLAAERENLENDRPSLFTFRASEARLADEGEGPDAAAGDGVVSGCLGPATVAGSHRVKLVVSGERSDGTRLQRTRLLSTHVLPGSVDPGGTSVVAVTTPAEPDRSRLIVVPVDVFGNPLGPGLAGRISISVSDGSLLGELRDHGDGYYSQDWQLPPSVPSAKATVQIDGIQMSSQPAFPR